MRIRHHAARRIGCAISFRTALKSNPILLLLLYEPIPLSLSCRRAIASAAVISEATCAASSNAKPRATPWAPQDGDRYELPDNESSGRANQASERSCADAVLLWLLNQKAQLRLFIQQLEILEDAGFAVGNR